MSGACRRTRLSRRGAIRMRLPNFWEHLPKQCRRPLFFLFPVICLLAAGSAMAQQVSAPEPQTGSIVGTATDVRNDVIPEVTVVLQGPDASDKRTIMANENGFFSFSDVKPGVPYHVTVSAKGFADWVSPTITI